MFPTGESPPLVTTWADRIRPHLVGAVESIIDAGRALIDAKAALPHGEFGPLLTELGLSPQHAQRFMRVAQHPLLTNPSPGRHLPASVTVLDELTRVPDDELEEAIESGAVNPSTTREEAKALRDPFAGWSEDEKRLHKQLESGDTIVINMRKEGHEHLTAWAKSADLLVRIDRSGPWGNPFETPADGDRETVIANYADHYLPHKPSLIDRLGDLQGKALGCWCAPDPCHGDILKREADG